MAMTYQITQERFEPGFDAPTRDEYPVLFGSVEEAREHVKRTTLGGMFEHDGDSHYIAELDDSYVSTGRTFEVETASGGTEQ